MLKFHKMNIPGLLDMLRREHRVSFGRAVDFFTAGGPILKKTGVVWAHLLRACSFKDCSDAVLEESCDRSRGDHVSAMKCALSMGY